MTPTEQQRDALNRLIVGMTPEHEIAQLISFIQKARFPVSPLLVEFVVLKSLGLLDAYMKGSQP